MTLRRTPSQTVGPYYAIGLCRRDESRLVDAADQASLRLHGQLLDGDRQPVSDGLIEVFDHVGGRFARSGTDHDGRFSFIVSKPAAGPGEAARLDVWVHARGLLRNHLTRIYFPDEGAANAADPVLAGLTDDGRATLVAQAEDGALRFDIHLQGDHETVFFAH